MDTKLKRKWVEALMSGEYEQAKGYLHSFGGYCCLGVLCHAVMHDTIYEGQGYLYDAALLQVVGLADKEQTELSKLNDEGVPFEMIAGFIQENL